ncbi:efflux RND transporter periplasmic adaptor subunit [Azohydromonas australica]|uniref:efflux RND transporter periplasmic adaptor subunit n=1 Tax=Azohydromonas australica TaxID=364039 RepID=UPI00048F11EF|nr:efflux RND transporter periplasmic adaptor subunit [Azohydromonas australica]
MRTKKIVAALLAAGALAATGFGLYSWGLRRGMEMSPAAPAPSGFATGAATGVDPSSWSVPQGEEATRRHVKDRLKAGDVDPVTGRKILYYHDPMVPGKKFDAPGKSPFMDMMLVPAYAGSEGADASSITVSPRIQQNLGLRTAPVVEAVVAPQVSAVGSIDYNERDQAVVQARAMGYVEKLHVRATLDRIARGQPLAELYIPDWVAAQEEYLSVRRMQGTDLAPLVEGARQRMRLAGMEEAQIRLVEASGRVQPRVTVSAPLSGVVAELMVREGMTVMPGMTLARIQGVSTVWAQAEVPESQAALLRPGTPVRASSPAVPGKTFEGRVQALLPQVSADTRTLKARMELPNPGGQLVPGMFVRMELIGGQPGKSLAVPSEAVIQTGRRAVVMLAEEGGSFRPVEVETGREAGGQTEIRRGLQAGQRVVLSGQFLIDSEASLRGLETRLNSEPAAAAVAVPADTHRTNAQVEAVQGGMVTLTHPPIPSLKWPAMTMDFQLPPGKPAAGLAPGARVEIEFRMRSEGAPQITSIRPLASAAAAGARP